MFDNLGRMTQMSQITDGQTYTSKYTYNFAGALVEEEYPSGRKVKNEFESDGDISRIYGTANPSATERTYANTFSYTPDGRIEKLRLGNGLWEKAKFNSRLQVTEMAVGIGVDSGNLWKLGYEYGEIDTNGNVDTAKNTGNVARQTLSFNGLASPFVQTYKYDSLYRLTEAKETSNGNQTWKQNFSFDRYGNRLTHEKFAGTTQLSLSVPEHPTIETATNRLSSGQGFTFDANGNLIIDAENRGFTFNGDNKQTVVRNLNITPPQQDPDANVIGKYFYDGEGKRIKKVSATETTVFVYSAGKLIAEYSTATPPPNPTTSWTVTDQLGSPRVIVNSFGQVVSRRDFMPFGEELDADETYRKSLYKYGQTDSVRQKFTGYQNDTETGLDFAEARMYQNLHGRFTAVDPLLASGKSANPQTFNRYVYVLNSPLVFTDPTGLQVASWKGSVYTNGRTFGPEPFIGENSWAVEGAGLRFVDASDGYSYSYNESGSTLLGRTADLDAWKAKMNPAPIQQFIAGAAAVGNDVTNGMGVGTENFAKGVWNFLSQPGGVPGAMVGIPNPLGLDRSQAGTPRAAAYAFSTEALWGAGTAAATGGAASSGISSSSTLSVVPRTAVPDGSFYSVAFEATLPKNSYPGGSYWNHFKTANTALDNAIKSDAAFAKGISDLGISIPRSQSGSILGRSPSNWVWHHAERPGTLQLVPKSQHPSVPGGIFWNTMHPGGIGGMRRWGQ